METHQHQQQLRAKVSKLPLWIIEYVWTHKMADVLEDVDPSCWPEMDSQPLSLEDPGRLRVASAKVYSMVRNRDIEHFEKVVTFLEETYRLLPRLVAPIKHMKIVFGLKTLLIMWMLKQEKRMIDTMFKINQFFPSRLPQYQNQCNRREIFLMKKNHLDFKDLAQSLAMDKGKLERYVTNQMQQQYGEHYVQKVEDRLLQYLHTLESVLPRAAYIDKLLKKESPVSEEEKLLLEVISFDSATIATTLKKLLHCEVTFLDLGKTLPEYGRKSPQLSKSPHCSTSFESNLTAVNLKTDLQFQGREEPAESDIPVDSRLLLENEEDLECRPLHQTTRDDQMTKESGDSTDEELIQGSSEELHSSPQFCSKHQRWVKSILQECPEDGSDDLLRQANPSASPPLFHSSSSRPSSQELTPSDLLPWTDASDQLQPPQKTRENDQMSSGSSSSSGSASKSQPMLQPASFRDTPMPLPPPKVQMMDVVSVGGPELSLKPHQAFPNCSAATPRNHDSFSQITPLSQSGPQNVPAVSTQHTRLGKAVRQSPSTPAGVADGSRSGGLPRAPLRFSLASQAVLLRSKLLQPRVSLTRLSSQHCLRATGGRSAPRQAQSSRGRGEGTRTEEDGDQDSSFDLNLLYSSRSSSSGGDDSALWDPDYQPGKKKRLLLEYEAARKLV